MLLLGRLLEWWLGVAKMVAGSCGERDSRPVSAPIARLLPEKHQKSKASEIEGVNPPAILNLASGIERRSLVAICFYEFSEV